ncbi:MAG: hypothetical protein GX330_01160 [Bacteroidales bacterium]|nr:hypothetical protein [Bacteroidales bacterium]
MNKKIFLTELIIGISGVVLISFFGVNGVAVFALYAIVPFFKEKKEESIESKLLFYKTNSITFAAGFLLLFLLFFIQEIKLITNNSLQIKDIWLYLFTSFSLFIHGVIGLIFLRRIKR